MKMIDQADLPEALWELLALQTQIEQDSRAIAGGKIVGEEFHRTAQRLAAAQLVLIDDMPAKMSPWLEARGIPPLRAGEKNRQSGR